MTPNWGLRIELPRLEPVIMKRIINGFEVDWASERVFAEQQTAPNMDICLRSPPIGYGL